MPLGEKGLHMLACIGPCKIDGENIYCVCIYASIIYLFFWLPLLLSSPDQGNECTLWAASAGDCRGEAIGWGGDSNRCLFVSPPTPTCASCYVGWRRFGTGTGETTGRGTAVTSHHDSQEQRGIWNTTTSFGKLLNLLVMAFLFYFIIQ